MKKILSNLIIINSLFLLLLTYNIYSQNNVSLETYILIQQYNHNKTNIADFKKQYNLLDETDLTIKAFITYNDNLLFENLEKLGCKIGLKTDKIITITIPIDKLEEVAALSGVLQISIESKVNSTLDKALPTANIQQVHLGEGLDRKYDGTGVIIGITDWGFDFGHSMFKTKDGKSRIKRVWITNDETGNPPNGYDGTLYTDSSFIATKLLYSSDKDNHGTHVMGIAAGTEVQGTKSTYSGVAPGADIVAVELYGVTKIDNPKVSLLETVDYIFKYADSVNKPVVINMSLGSTLHPGDGTSERDIILSYLINKNPKGKIIVASAGNNGYSNMHKEYKFNNDTCAFGISSAGSYNNNNKGTRCVNIWGNRNDNFKAIVIIKCEDGREYKSKWYATNNAMNIQEILLDNQISLWIRTNSAYIFNEKPFITIYAYGLSKNDKMNVYVVSDNANVHIWNANGAMIFDTTYSEIIGDNEYSIGSPGIIDDVITVGASVSRTTTESLTGTVTNGYSGKLNGIANFSSHGPSTNGTIKPDIVGAGSVIYSALNPYCALSSYEENTYLVDEINTANSCDYLYAMSGTSMSAPLVSGIVALMLEINPNLTNKEIKDILRITAINDEFTGDAKENKNSIWGWGKIDALSIMKKLENISIDTNKSINNNILIVPFPIVKNKIYINIENISNNNMPSLVQIFDINGNLVFISSINNEKEFDVSNLSNGNYFIKINNEIRNFIIIK